MQKILIIEDDKSISSAYKLILEKEGYEVSVIENIDAVEDTVSKILPDLIILDVILPDKSGINVLHSIKVHPIHKNIPIIVASNLDQIDTIDKAVSMGAFDYIVKVEASLEDIVNKVKNALDSVSN